MAIKFVILLIKMGIVKMSKIGYKATINYVCRDKKYVVGKTYSMKSLPEVCRRGFHYCLDAANTLNYYDYSSNFKLLEIEDLSDNTSSCDYEKSATNKIKIVREITDPDELLKLLGIFKQYDENCVLIYEKTKDYEVKFCNGIKTEKTEFGLNNFWTRFYYDKRGFATRIERSDGTWEENKVNNAGYIIQTKKSNGFLYEAIFKNDKQISYKDTDGNSKYSTKLRNGNTVIIVKTKGKITSKEVTDSRKRLILAVYNDDRNKEEIKIKFSGSMRSEDTKNYIKHKKTGKYKLVSFEKNKYKNGNLIFSQDSTGNLLKIEYKNGKKVKTTVEVY